MEKDLISIVIPVYNATKWLSRCISSVISQRCKMEIIFVDDGSTDNSIDIIRSACLNYQCHDKCIKYIQTRHAGVSTARNLGIKEANGEYIYFMDADDEMLSNALGKLHSMIVEYKADMVFSNAYNINDLGVVKAYYHHEDYLFSGREEVVKLVRDYANDPKSFKILATGWSKLFKLQIIKENKIKWNEKMMVDEDALFVLDYMYRCNTIYYIGKELYRYYHILGNDSQSTKAAYNPLEFLEVIKSFSRILKEDCLDKTVIKNCCAEWGIWRMFQISFHTNWSKVSSVKIAYRSIRNIMDNKSVRESMGCYVQKHDDNPSMVPDLIQQKDIRNLMRVFREHVLNLKRRYERSNYS